MLLGAGADGGHRAAWQSLGGSPGAEPHLQPGAAPRVPAGRPPVPPDGGPLAGLGRLPFNFQFSIRIKWPNDIYVGGKKLCGTLVSTRLQGDTIASAVCGIGLNVNQREFPSWVPNPTSLSLLTGRLYELEPLLVRLLDCIEKRYDDLRAGLDPEAEYLERLMNLGVPARYIYKEETLEATITGVDPHGRLLLTASDGRYLSCGMKEIVFL
ncbi:MAG: hypothetical protein IJ524_03520 [Bacteroidales bacterium]|nr:hypothetical protein [Bacteroidales bacterium]